MHRAHTFASSFTDASGLSPVAAAPAAALSPVEGILSRSAIRLFGPRSLNHFSASSSFLFVSRILRSSTTRTEARFTSDGQSLSLPLQRPHQQPPQWVSSLVGRLERALANARDLTDLLAALAEPESMACEVYTRCRDGERRSTGENAEVVNLAHDFDSGRLEGGW